MYCKQTSEGGTVFYLAQMPTLIQLVACIEHMKAIVRLPLGQCMLRNVVIYQWESLYDCAS